MPWVSLATMEAEVEGLERRLRRLAGLETFTYMVVEEVLVPPEEPEMRLVALRPSFWPYWM